MVVATEQSWRAYPHSMMHRLTRGAFEITPHIRLWSTAVAEMVDGGGGLLVFEGPPRHGKTETHSRAVPIWFLSEHPTKNVILAGYGASLPAESGRYIRNTINENSAELGIQIADDSSAADRWHTSAGGSCMTVGVGSALTGFGGHLIVVDDPIKDAEEADSEVMRNKIWEWFLAVLWTRREPGCVVVVMCTRWHEDDLIGRILAHPRLGKIAKRITLPALAEENDPLGRDYGQALWPERFDERALADIRDTLSVRWWNAVFQQRPTAAEGAEILRQWWRWYDELPVPREQLEYVCASWDCTFKDKASSDWVVGQVWGVYGTYRYLLEQVRSRMGFVDSAAAIVAMHEKWRPNVSLVELAANGDAIVQSLQSLVPAIVGVQVQGKGSKIARARAISPIIQAGQVLLPRDKKFSDELIEECAGFPLGKHDDQVDALSQALKHMTAFANDPVTHLRPSDNRFVPPHILELQERGLLGGLGKVNKRWLG